jgi:hypothetical protein
MEILKTLGDLSLNYGETALHGFVRGNRWIGGGSAYVLTLNFRVYTRQYERRHWFPRCLDMQILIDPIDHALSS